MSAPLSIIDAWMQHPTPRFIEQPMFESLRRWTGGETIREIPIEFTLGAMDAAGVRLGMLAAWCGPQGWLISHDEVAALVQKPTSGPQPRKYNAEGYVQKIPEDPWGNPYVYLSDTQSFVLKCLGGDGEQGGEGKNADIDSRDLG